MSKYDKGSKWQLDNETLTDKVVKAIGSTVFMVIVMPLLVWLTLWAGYVILK